MRINTFGGDGLNINGRIILKNGTPPLDLNYGSGIRMYKADNSALLGFMGVQNNQNLGFYGATGGWELRMMLSIAGLELVISPRLIHLM
jgi:hypothetical protein